MQTITVTQVSKVFGLIGMIAGALLFLFSTFVLAADYRDDQLTMQATFIEMQLDSLEDRIERATYKLDIDKVNKLEHRRDRLEKKQDIIMGKQLEG